jgi:uroporphyrinogen decarboxylase
VGNKAMNSRERVIAALRFQNPDRVPVDMWIHRATQLKYGEDLDALLERYPLDIVRLFGPTDRNFYPEMSDVGDIKDAWGSTWRILRQGINGEVKIPAIEDIAKVQEYHPPLEWLAEEWQKHDDMIDRKIEAGRKNNTFIYGGYIEIFQRMQFIRGTENLLYDLAGEPESAIILRDKVTDYFKQYLGYWLKKDVDAIYFSDDFGTQRSLLISPKMWREIFKPAYKEIMDIVKESGKFIFYHTCGHVLALYPEFIELGIDAVNSQIHCMGLENLAEKFAGKITFWGEMDRQSLLPFGTPQEIYRAAGMMKEKLFVNGGGLIGHSVAGVDVPLENIEAILTCWNKQ